MDIPNREELLAEKRRHPRLDRLLPDDKVLADAMRPEVVQSVRDAYEHPSTGEEVARVSTGPFLSVGMALYSPNLLAPLEKCLETVVPEMTREQRKELSDGLLNATQFLHSVSELGLARRLVIDGFKVDMFVRFHEKKNVDIKATVGDQDYLIEVTNLAAKTWQSPTEGWGPPPTIDTHLVKNIVDKYNKKFGEALTEGWDGPIWIAFDFGKAHPTALGVALFQAMMGPALYQVLASKVFESAPKLRGVIYYCSSLGWPEIVPQSPIWITNPAYQ